MTTTSEPCRDCGRGDGEELDSLPDSLAFAGIRLAKPLAGGRLYRCIHCSLVFRSPVLSASEYSALYAQASADVWTRHRDVLRTDQSLVKQFIESARPAGAKVLDVGCYTGELLAALPAHYEKFGVEKSVQAANACTEAGIRILGDDLYALSSMAERFDVIVAMDVVEHTLSPDRFVQVLLGLLTKGGIVILTTGDADNAVWRRLKGAFWYCSYPEHISFISPSWLRLNAKKNRYRLEHLRLFDYVHVGGPKRLVQRLLIRLCGMVGRRARASWTAHLSQDHLLAVIRPDPA